MDFLPIQMSIQPKLLVKFQSKSMNKQCFSFHFQCLTVKLVERDQLNMRVERISLQTERNKERLEVSVNRGQTNIPFVSIHWGDHIRRVRESESRVYSVLTSIKQNKIPAVPVRLHMIASSLCVRMCSMSIELGVVSLARLVDSTISGVSYILSTLSLQMFTKQQRIVSVRWVNSTIL